MNLNAIALGLRTILPGEYSPAASFDFLFGGSALDSRITYSGDSARWYFDSTGTLRLAPQNLLTHSEDFSNAAWVKNEATVSGTDTIIPSTVSSALHRVQQGSLSFASNASITLAGKVKASGYNFVLVRVSNSGETVAFQVNLNVNTGSLVSAASAYGSGASAAGATISAAAEGNGWFDFTLTGSISGVTSYVVTIYVYNSAGGPVFAGDGTSGVKVKNFQINRGSTAFDYIPTTTAAVYLPRSNAFQDHNPSTLAPLGFLIEEQRTNSIRNNTMQGAVVGTPGTLPTNWTNSLAAGITQQIVGTGADNGITYVDWRISGTATGTSQILFETNVDVTASSGQSWSGTAYVKLQSGSLANITNTQMCIREGTSAGAFVRDEIANFTPTSAALNVSRRSVQIASTNASTQRVNLRIFVVHAGAIDITLRIGLPQLELGAFATSPILTTTAAATRLADVASITGTAFSSFWDQVEGTIVTKAIGVNNVAGSTRRFIEVNDGTSTERYVLGYAATNTNRFLVTDGGVTVADPTTSSTAGQQVRMAAAYKVDDIIQATNGTLSAGDTSATLPTVTAINIGADIGAAAATCLNGHLQSLTYYNRRLPDSTIQALTV